MARGHARRQSHRFVLAPRHSSNIVALEVQHFACCERSRFDGDKLTAVNPTVEIRLDFGEHGLAHRPPERVSQEPPFIHDGFPFHLPVARPGHGCMGVLCAVARLADDCPALRLCHNSLGLVPVGGGDLPMPLEHPIGTERRLGITGSVRCDLSRPRALESSGFEVLADLPATWAACLQVLPGIASDFRGAVLCGFRQPGNFRALIYKGEKTPKDLPERLCYVGFLRTKGRSVHFLFSRTQAPQLRPQAELYNGLLAVRLVEPAG